MSEARPVSPRKVQQALGYLAGLHSDDPSRVREVSGQQGRAMQLDAVRRGELQALIARSADFYGPGARLSLLEAVFFARLRAGKAPQWVGNPDLAHTFTFTPDAGLALAVLGQAPEAFGQTWHLPTAQLLDGAVVTGQNYASATPVAVRAPRFSVRVSRTWKPCPSSNFFSRWAVSSASVFSFSPSRAAR